MTPEDWTGLTDAQRAERLAGVVASLIPAEPGNKEMAGILREAVRIRVSIHALAGARAALASYRASLEAAPVLDAEAGEGARAMADQIVAWSITKQPKLLDEPQAYKAALIRLGAIAGLNYRLHKEPR